ncbi:MAG TPA: YncE family protein, partial [Stellaceae bacterium]|nr:YncE family protein [Stellaceae bacterium]
MRAWMLAGWAIAALGVGGSVGGAVPAFGQLLIVGNDEKQGWDDTGKPIFREPGKDTFSVIDISKPEAPRIAATIPLINSVVGPPTNLAITPAGDFALVANSLAPVIQGWGHRLGPDNKVFLIDLKSNPPGVVGTITVGKQPSGLAISSKGDLALVTNRADGTISVLSLRGKDVLVVDTVPIGAAADQVSAVAITADGRHALAAKAAANKIALLSIDGQKVSYDKRDLPTGIFPYNVAVTPDGKLALTVDNGNSGASDGNVDTVSVIDLEANPPRVIDHVTVGDSPEGLAISPKGDFAVSVEARGSNMPKTAFFYHPGGAVTALKIDGKNVSNVGEVNVGALPEG